MSSRRTFLQILVSSGVASMFGREFDGIVLGCQTNAWPIDPANVSTFLAVLDKIKDYGFQGFETGFANLQNEFSSPTDAKRAISATNLQFFGIHIFLQKYDPDTHIAPSSLYERVARGGAGLDAERLILSGAPVSDTNGVDRRALARKVEALNRAGRFAKSTGLHLAAYHNHAAEFDHGAAEITALMQDTDPADVGFLLDAGHAYEAGADVPNFFSLHHRRIIGLHLRDYKDNQQVPLGSGGFPLAQLAAVIQKLNWSGWVLCEEERLRDKPGDAAVRPAREALFRVFRGES